MVKVTGVLTSISSRQRGAISGRQLPKRTDFGPAVCSSTDPHMPCPWQKLPQKLKMPDSHLLVYEIYSQSMTYLTPNVEILT